MTEERRVDATKEPLDDAEIEVVPPAQHPPVVASPRASRPAATEVAGPASAPPSSSQPRAREASSPASKRARGRMAIRIPDDEISRPSPTVVEPTPTTPQLLAVEDAPAASAPLQPMRIISIDASPSAHAKARTDADGSPDAGRPATPPAGAPAGTEDSWTPFQPTAADARPSEPIALDAPVRAASPSEELIPIESESEPEGVDSAEQLDLDDASVAQIVPAPPKAVSPSAPPVANGRGAVRPLATPQPSPAAVARASAPTEPEGEEVDFEDEEAQPTQPRLVAKDRVSEPGDAPEIAPEDLVSVESAPDPRSGVNVAAKSERGQYGPPTPVVSFTPPAAAKPATGASAKAAAAALPPMRARTPTMPNAGTAGAVAAQAVPVPAKPLTPPPPAPPPGSRAPLVIVPPHSGVAPPSSEAGARRKARPWWEDLFNDDFIRTMAKISDSQIASEADFIEDSLGVAKGGTLLDLCCGTGRHAIELSRRGYEVVGFDLSLAMLARAADEAQEREQKLNFVQGDMREMTFEETFDGVYCWNTSFGFFDEDSNAKVVERIRKSLKKGGQFVLDVVNRDFIVTQAPSLAWFEGDGCVCMDEMSIDWITSRMKVKRTMMMDDGRSKEIDYSVRVYSLHELGKILHDQGFRVAEVSGRTASPGVFFGGVSPRTLILAEKR